MYQPLGFLLPLESPETACIEIADQTRGAHICYSAPGKSRRYSVGNDVHSHMAWNRCPVRETSHNGAPGGISARPSGQDRVITEVEADNEKADRE